MDRANRARSDGELAALVADLDLSGLDTSGLPGRQGRSGGEGRAVSPKGSSRSGGGGPGAGIDGARVPERQLTIAFWSARARRGAWIPARRILAVAFQGGVELDFRGAVFGPGITEVRALAFMGAVDIIVPPELHLDTSGFAVLGAFEDEGGFSGPPDPEGPLLRLTGFALLGAVDVQVRLPGESERQARNRRRRERREAGS